MKHNLFLLVILSSILFSCNQKNDVSKADTPKPSGNCTYSRDDKTSSGSHVRMVEEEKFISLDFSDSTEKKAYNEEFFKGYLSCVSVDSILGIYFNFKIHTSDAFLIYGMIKKDNKVTFILSSGKMVEVPFGQTFSGNTDLSKETTEYSSFAVVTSAQAEQLTSEELGRVKISWSKKDEDYTVVNPKVFVNQIPCVAKGH